jgi:glucose-6-phosphate dehydrogenase assembly protein OpcA
MPEFGEPLTGPIGADAIEDALADAWRSASASIDPSHPPVRASVLTLVIGVPAPWSPDAALDCVEHLAEAHPARTIMLVADDVTDGPELQAWYGTGCVATDSTDLTLCGEQIILRANARGVHHLPALADQLMLPDLPAFLWWNGDLTPVTDVLFERLTELVDRVIVDSSTFAELTEALPRLRWLIDRRHLACALSDLTWTQLTPWRELLAQFFDLPTLRLDRDKLQSLTIQYASTTPLGAAQALLLLGWLADRFGWQLDASPLRLDRPGPTRLRAANGQAVDVTLQPESEAGVAGLRRVTLGAGAAGQLVVAREDDAVHALTEAQLADAPPLRRIVRLETPEPSVLLANELMLFSRDQVYEAALTRAVELTTVATA